MLNSNQVTAILPVKDMARARSFYENQLGLKPLGLNADGNLVCGNLRVRDARANIREAAPDVIQNQRILTISPGIPNDTLSFGPEFPAELRAQIEQALVAFSQTEAWNESIGSQDFYNWTGLTEASDAEYDFIRNMVAASGFSLEDIR
jgi:phosphonate transport system substrate-binding protein